MSFPLRPTTIYTSARLWMNLAGQKWLLLSIALPMTPPIGGRQTMQVFRRCCALLDSPEFNVLPTKFMCVKPIKIFLILLSKSLIHSFPTEQKIKFLRIEYLEFVTVDHNKSPNLEVLY